jgi:AraC family transcriptional regulator
MDDASPHRNAQDSLERARAFVEANAFGPLSLDSLAAVAGLSSYHFVRQFAARFGTTPMAFVRDQRMELAAARLGGDNPPTLFDLAYDLGFETQEGFTRAFKRAHGVSPGRYRRARPIGPSQEIAIMPVITASSLSLSPSPVRKPAFRVVGVSGVFDETNKSGIPALWPRLAARLPVAGQLGDDETFGVCWGDTGGAFHYMAAVPVAADAPVPEGLEAKEIPAQTYLVFRQETDGSDLHAQMQAAVKEIWGERLPRSGYKLANAPDLEAYPPHFEPDQPSHVEWWIPVEP